MDYKKELEELQKKIDNNENRISKNENKIDEHLEKIQKNSYALDILRDYKAETKRVYAVLIMVLIMFFLLVAYTILVK